MALTVTTLNGTITANQTLVQFTAYTAPTGATLIGPQVQMQFATGEVCLVADTSLSPTIQVVRGYAGTTAVAHTTGEGIQYGRVDDAAWPAAHFRAEQQPLIAIQAQEITATGTTGSTAAAVTIGWPGFVNATGSSNAGVNLPVPVVGSNYTIKNSIAGTLKVYSVGATINGTTGTTAISISNTGTLAASFLCSTAGAWQVAPAAT